MSFTDGGTQIIADLNGSTQIRHSPNRRLASVAEMEVQAPGWEPGRCDPVDCSLKARRYAVPD